MSPTMLQGRSRRARAVLLASAGGSLLAALPRAHHAVLLRRAMSSSFALSEIARSDEWVKYCSGFELVLVVTAIAVLARFAGDAYRAAGDFGTRALPYTERQARASFWIPGLHLIRPVFVFRALLRSVLTHDLQAPAPRVRADGSSDYRTGAAEPVPLKIAGPHPPLTAFWCAWIGAQVIARSADLVAFRDSPAVAQNAYGALTIIRASRLDAAANVLFAIALMLGARVVRGTDAAVREYDRRRRFAAAPIEP